MMSDQYWIQGEFSANRALTEDDVRRVCVLLGVRLLSREEEVAMMDEETVTDFRDNQHYFVDLLTEERWNAFVEEDGAYFTLSIFEPDADENGQTVEVTSSFSTGR